MLRPRFFVITVALVIICASAGLAENKAKIKQLTPTIKGSTGLFNLPLADTLREGEFSLALHTSKFNREPGDIDITVYPVSFTVGLNDRVEFFASYEVYKRVHAGAIAAGSTQFNGPSLPTRLPSDGRVYYNDTPFLDLGFGSGPGDLTAGVKFNLLSERRGDPLALAIQPIIKFAVGNDRVSLAQGLSSGLSDWGFDVILSKDAGPATFTVTGGLTWAEDFADINRRIERQNRVNYGLGVDVPLGTKKVHLIGEYVGSAFFGDRTTAYLAPNGTLGTALANPRSPQDLYGGLRFFPAKWFAVSAAYNYYFNRIDENVYGIPATDHTGWFAQVAFQRKINRPPSIDCSAASTSIIEGTSTMVNATVDDPDDDVLTVTWKSSGGRITSSDTSATFDATGTAPGNYMVMATVEDTEGAVASCSVDIEVKKDKKPPTVTCEPSTSSVTEGGSTTLRANASDPNGDALTYAWTVDGQAVTNTAATFEFGSTGRATGNHKVGVTVTDVDGMSASCSFDITVNRKPNNNPTCSLTLDKTTVYAGEAVGARVQANDPDGDPLTYSWTVDGQPTGSGASISIDTSGKAGGPHTVTATVRDDRGGSCTDTKTFSVREKIIIQIDNRPDNIAKAKLDEIALKLQQNPQLRATITGFTDDRGSETANVKVGQRRADALRDYIVKQHKIDVNRIETRSAGETQPIADNSTAEGRKQNRRGEVELYVP